MYEDAALILKHRGSITSLVKLTSIIAPNLPSSWILASGRYTSELCPAHLESSLIRIVFLAEQVMKSITVETDLLSISKSKYDLPDNGYAPCLESTALTIARWKSGLFFVVLAIRVN